MRLPNGLIKLKKEAIPTINSLSQQQKSEKIQLMTCDYHPSNYGFEIIKEFQDDEHIDEILVNSTENLFN